MVSMGCTEKKTFHVPSLAVGLSATRLFLKALPTGSRSTQEGYSLPLISTERTWSSVSYSTAGRVSGKGRGLMVYLLAGVSRSRAW